MSQIVVIFQTDMTADNSINRRGKLKCGKLPTLSHPVHSEKTQRMCMSAAAWITRSTHLAKFRLNTNITSKNANPHLWGGLQLISNLFYSHLDTNQRKQVFSLC